jgi:copper chaperone
MTSFNVPDMTCEGCVRAIASAVQRLDPEGTVVADLPAHEVRVSAEASDEALLAALQDAGFSPMLCK